MRPHELDYGNRAKHYFDLSNGEVLVGRDQKVEHLSNGADPEQVVPLGPLLRIPTRDAKTWDYDRLPVGDWDRDKYIAYGRWIRRVISPPSEQGEQSINRVAIDNAARLGLGAGSHQIRGEFDDLSSFYVKIKAEDAHIKGFWSDWTLYDFAAYLRRVGGDVHPTRSEVDACHKRNPALPNATVIRDRFKELGHFEGALTLAGYQIIERWSYDDYLRWGLKFMEANDGMLPVQTSIDYLSKKRLGPSAKTVAVNCNGLPTFQQELKIRFTEQQLEKRQAEKQKLETLEGFLELGIVPKELFLDTSVIEEVYDIRERIARFAKFRVLTTLLPNMSLRKRIDIAAGKTDDRGFIPAIRKHYDISAGEIEHAALVMDFFDDIWPMDRHLQTMRLGEDYDNFRTLRGRRKSTKERLTQTVS